MVEDPAAAGLVVATAAVAGLVAVVTAVAADDPVAAGLVAVDDPVAALAAAVVGAADDVACFINYISIAKRVNHTRLTLFSLIRCMR